MYRNEAKVNAFWFCSCIFMPEKITQIFFFHIVAVSEMNKIQEAMDFNSLHIYFTN